MAQRESEHDVGRAAAGLQRAFGAAAVGVDDVDRSARQLQPAEPRPRGLHVVRQALMPRQHLHVAELGEAPLLARGGLAGRGVDEVVHMVALDDGDAQRQRPALVEAVGQRRDDIEVLRVPLDGLFDLADEERPALDLV